jgi:hypothetical protein
LSPTNGRLSVWSVKRHSYLMMLFQRQLRSIKLFCSISTPVQVVF